MLIHFGLKIWFLIIILSICFHLLPFFLMMSTYQTVQRSSLWVNVSFSKATPQMTHNHIHHFFMWAWCLFHFVWYFFCHNSKILFGHQTSIHSLVHVKFGNIYLKAWAVHHSVSSVDISPHPVGSWAIKYYTKIISMLQQNKKEG